jgi:hypothetical protein
MILDPCPSAVNVSLTFTILFHANHRPHRRTSPHPQALLATVIVDATDTTAHSPRIETLPLTMASRLHPLRLSSLARSAAPQLSKRTFHASNKMMAEAVVPPRKPVGAFKGT